MLRGDAHHSVLVNAMVCAGAHVVPAALTVAQAVAEAVVKTVANTHVNHSVLVHNAEGGKPNKIHLACTQVR